MLEYFLFVDRAKWQNLFCSSMKAGETGMKENIHPQYFEDAVLKCACGRDLCNGIDEKNYTLKYARSVIRFYRKAEARGYRGRVEKFKKYGIEDAE